MIITQEMFSNFSEDVFHLFGDLESTGQLNLLYLKPCEYSMISVQ